MTYACPGVALLVVIGVALGALGTASGQSHTASKYGGTLVVGLSQGEPNSLDPTVGGSVSSLEIYPAMCQRLYTSDDKLQLAPLLAAALPELSKDKLTYTVRLRRGIEFNDGTPFDAQAVVTSVQRLMTSPVSVREDFKSVESVVASAPYTVVFRLKGRDAAFTANPYALSPAQLAKLGDNFGSNPVCVGPFMFDHRVAGDHITLIKSPYYYDRAHVYLDKIVYKPMPQEAAASAALKAGDVQALDQVSSTELPAVQQTSSLRTIRSPQLGWQGLEINIGNRNGIGQLPYGRVNTPLGSSTKLRQAFEEAIDRKTLNRVVFGGLVQVGCTPTGPSNIAWYEATTIPCTPYDPKHARQLIASSGFSNPTVHLSTSDTSPRLRLAQFIQAQEAAVGIDVVIDAFDSPTSIARGISGNFDARLGSNVTGNPEPSAPINMYLGSSGVSNFSGYSNRRLDYVLANGLKATDHEARAVNYRVAQQIIQADRPIIVLYHAIVYAAFSTQLTGLQLGPNGLLRVEKAQFR
jgi:peptide/nickel transport system substrate-binding protein